MDPFNIEPEMVTVLDDASNEDLLDFAKVYQDHDADTIELYIYILFLNFRQTGSIEHLEAAVLQAEGWIAETPNDHPQYSHRSSIHDLLVANMLHDNEQKKTAGVTDDVFESLGVGVNNNENLHYLISEAKAWLIVASPEHPQRDAAMWTLSHCYKTLFQINGDLSNLSTSIEITEEMIATSFGDNIQQARHFAMLAKLKRMRFDQTKEPGDLDSVIDAIDMAVVLAPSDEDNIEAHRLEFLGVCLGDRFSIAGAEDDLDRGIETIQKALALKTSSGQDRIQHLSSLDILLHKRWVLTKAMEDLDLLLQNRDLMLELGATTCHQAKWLYQSSALVELKFVNNGVIKDLDRAVELASLAIEFTTSKDKRNRALHLDHLASLFRSRFNTTAAISDLNQIIEIGLEVLVTTPDHDRRLYWLIELAIFLEKRFTMKHDIADLDLAIAHAQLAVKDVDPDDSKKHGDLLGYLATLLAVRYQLTPAVEDVNEAVESLELALKVAPESNHRSFWYGNLANFLSDRFKYSKSMGDINRAVEYAEISVAGKDFGEENVKNFVNLGTILSLRFAQTGKREDLNRAVEVAEMAVEAVSPVDPNRVSILLNIAYILNVRYEQLGQQQDLKRIIDIFEKVETMLSRDSPVYGRALSTFAVALGERFEATQSTDDLARALKLAKVGASSVATDSLHRSLCFTNLGNILGLQYGRTRNPEDRDSAIKATEVALEAEHNHSQPITMSNLATALIGRFDSTGDSRDLDRAVKLLELALQSTPASFDGRNTIYFNLSTCHDRLFKRTGKTQHLNQSVEIIKTAVQLLPPSNPDRARTFLKAGLYHEYRHSELGDSQDLDEACRLYSAGLGCENSKPMHRIMCADSAARAHADQQNWEQSTFFFEAGLNLLPVVSPRSLKNSDKQYTLGVFAGLATRGAGAALVAGRPASEALKLLELGRSVIAGLVLEMRTDIIELREKHPELAGQFTSLRDELDIPNQDFMSLEDVDSLSLGRSESKRRQEADQQFKEVIEKIRELPNFEEFLLPPTVNQTKVAARNGPIAVINVSQYRCDAFLITSSEIIVLELPNLHERDVNQHAVRLNTVGVTSLMLEWLWDVLARPVLEALGSKQPPSDDDWPHLWWVPTGALTQLPIHAAGYHFRGSTETTLDRVISSYSSSVKALIYGRRNDTRRRATPDQALFKGKKKTTCQVEEYVDISLLVGMSKTPGLLTSDLPYAEAEVEMVDEICSSIGMETMQPVCSREQVLKHMTTCSIFHFAGHGQTHPSDPSRSCLLLDDWEKTPLTVGDLRDSNMHNNAPFLGYLSACSTGANESKKLLDEGIHLISAFQLAGFRHVIGTLWEVSDRHCVEVARVLYETIRDEGMTDKAIHRGLHRAVRALRDGYLEDRRAVGMGAHMACDENSTESQEVQSKEGKRVGRDMKLIETGIQISSQENPQYWAPYVHFGV